MKSPASSKTVTRHRLASTGNTTSIPFISPLGDKPSRRTVTTRWLVVVLLIMSVFFGSMYGVPRLLDRPSGVEQQLDSLRVAAPLTPGSVKAFGSYSSVDGCLLTVAYLISDGQDVTSDGCTLTSGKWRSTYEGEALNVNNVVSSYVVPLMEVLRSGGELMPEAKLNAYKNDFNNLSVQHVTFDGERKSKDPSSWTPEVGKCQYVSDWINVKYSYDLTVDPGELKALRAFVATCGWT